MFAVEKYTCLPDIEAELNPREGGSEILDILKKSSLPAQDEGWILEAVLANVPQKDLILAGTLNLLRQSETDQVRRKIEERKRAKKVDLMELADPFTEEENRTFTSHLYSLQLTDGCTVGCPWCGGCAKRGIERSFSLRSIKNYLDKFGSSFRRGVLLSFHNNDPFDWVDGDYSYRDFFLTLCRKVKSIYPLTSTAVPEGSEFAVLRFLDTLHIVWQQAKLRHLFRFSKTKDNDQRIDQILTILRAKGVSEEFIESLEISPRDEKNVQHVGYFINHPKRDLFEDALGIECFDGLYLTPDRGFVSTCMESVTSKNPTGSREQILQPGTQEIPYVLDIYDYIYSKTATRNINTLPLLPEIRYQIFENGQLVGVRTVSSTLRDSLSFDLILDYLNATGKEIEKLRKTPGNFGKLLRLLRSVRRDFQPEFERRSKICRQRLENEPDQEAVQIAEKFMQSIEGYLGTREPLTT